MDIFWKYIQVEHQQQQLVVSSYHHHHQQHQKRRVLHHHPIVLRQPPQQQRTLLRRIILVHTVVLFTIILIMMLVSPSISATFWKCQNLQHHHQQQQLYPLVQHLVRHLQSSLINFSVRHQNLHQLYTSSTSSVVSVAYSTPSFITGTRTTAFQRLYQPTKVQNNKLTERLYYSTIKYHNVHLATVSRRYITTVQNDSNDSSNTDIDSSDPTYYDPSLFDSTITNFEMLGIQSPILLQRLQQQQLFRPTKVQTVSYNAILQQHEQQQSNNNEGIGSPSANNDVTIACETGSGKTLAYLLPLIDDILQRKQKAFERSNDKNNNLLDVGYDYARAVILVPNKELVQQVVRMAAPLAGGGRHSLIYGGHTLPDPSILDETTTRKITIDPPLPHNIVRMAIMPGGLNEPSDFVPFRQTVAIGGGTQPPIDLLITTPAAIGPLALSPKNIAFFADIQTLVVDEADMLLDGGYIRALENVLMGFKRADRLDAVKLGEIPKTQHVFVAATLPNYGLRSVDAYLMRKFPNALRIELDSLHMARHSGLQKPTIWMEMESKKERMVKLVELFNSSNSEETLQNEKVMIFLNSVADCEASCEALQRAGIRCAPYHAQIPLQERTFILERFRKYNVNHEKSNISVENGNDDSTSPIPVLVCTDLASRGLDVPGVSVVVQLQFCGNVVGHLHRMGRCGRGGNERQYGRGYVFYGMKERALVETVMAAEKEQEQMILPGDVVTKEWNDTPDDDVISGTNDSIGSNQSTWYDENDNKNRDYSAISTTKGKVTEAFSRKRGFTKKLKKLRREGDSYPE